MSDETREPGPAPGRGAAGAPEARRPYAADPVGETPWWRRVDRRWLLVAAVALVVVVVIAVWWASRTPVGVLARAVAATLAEGSAGVELATTARDLPFVGDVDVVVASGVVAFETGESRLSRQLVGGVATELRRVEDGLFLQVPLSGGRWVRLRDAAELPTSAADPTTFAPDLTNPVVIVGLLARLDAIPRQVGSRALDDGTPVTEYLVELDLAEAGRLADDELAATLERLRRLVGGPTLPLRIAIDDDMRIRSIAFSTPLRLGSLLTATLRTRIDLSDFGVPVDVQAPPAERVVEVDTERLRALDPLGRLRDLLPLPG